MHIALYNHQLGAMERERTWTYKYLGAKAVVVTAMMNDTMATTGGSTTCRYRSPVLSACHALVRMASVPIRYGGAVSRRVVMLFLPRPLTTLLSHIISVQFRPNLIGVSNRVYLRGEESRHCPGGCETVCRCQEEPGFWIPRSVFVS